MPRKKREFVDHAFTEPEKTEPSDYRYKSLDEVLGVRQKLYDQIEALSDDAYKSLVELLRSRGFPTGD